MKATLVLRKYLFLIRILLPCLILVSGIVVKTCCADSFLKTRVEKIDTPQLKEVNRIKQVLRHFDIPRDIGFIKELHVSNQPSEKLVITIQDLHCHYQAQKNIAALLDYLINTYGLKVVSVEGGSGKIDTTFYKELPDANVKEQVADYFLREARINGTEYFAITTKKDIALYGAEDAKYYDKNLEAFLKALPKRETILEGIAVLENDLNILKDRIYNKHLRELDDLVVAYDNGTLPFEDYVLYIADHYSQDKIKSEFTQLPNLVDSIRIKKDMDLEEAEKQRGEMIDYLTNKLTRLELEDFLKVTLEFKSKSIDSLQYHNRLKDLYAQMEVKSKTLDRAWPELSKYMEYLNKYETLDKFVMFHEINEVLDRIKDSMYTSYTQKDLDYCLSTVRLARNLFSTKLLTRDLPVMEKHKSDFSARKLTKFIKTQSKRLKLNLPIPAGINEMQENLPILEDFYDYASRRNDVLAENTLQGMNNEGECIGVLITGGFHTDGISEYFKERRISYVVIAPVVDKLDEDDTRYIRALQGKKTPFELQLEQEEKLAKQE
ncbi:MAG: hypothetical protein ABII88_00190 [Candidatus Omnitrophota bacterium]